MLIPLLSLLLAFDPGSATGPVFFVGTYSKAPSEGIYAFRLDGKSGNLEALGLAAKVSNPSFLAFHPNGNFLYAVNENSHGSVTAFAINHENNKLTELNQASTKGNGPCHLAVDPSGHFLIAVNYGSGSVTRIPIDAEGRLGEPSAFDQHAKPAGGAGTDPKRQEGPHAHCVNFSPDGKFAMVADLGRDEVITYKVDGGGLDAVHAAHLAPGSGPRHFALSPSGKVAYVVTELKSTVAVFDFDSKTGLLKETQTISTLPADFKGTSYGAEIAVHPSGRFLYTSNRGSNSIAMFAIGNGGKLKFLGVQSTRGDWPRGFGIDPTGHWMIAANQNSNTIGVFKIDQKSGKLQPVGNTVEVGSPVDIEFMH